MTALGSVPRVGCLGVGWIGRARLAALVESGKAEVVGICDPNPEARREALALAPGAASVERYEDLLALELDGVVIATPSALHARQCLRAFERGLSVFCQKPLARTTAETQAVLSAARRANRSLHVDFCYRHVHALRDVRDVVQSGTLGTVFAADLVFHNAYGPDQAWARDPELAGGGCLMDLGVHLVDAALFVLDEPQLESATARLFRDGCALRVPSHEVEDFALARLELSNGVNASLSCSWRSSFGTHARIRAEFWGTRGTAAFTNVDGSFFDFRSELYRGNTKEVRVEPPDAWSGRAILAWAEELARTSGYRTVTPLLEVARAMDALYERSALAGEPQRARLASASGSP